MIAMFLFLVVVVAAITLGNEVLQKATDSPEVAPGEDGMVALPRPDQLPRAPRQVSDHEMKFAGQYLHLGGLALVAIGLVARLRMSGTVQSAADSGLLPCLAGALLGIALSGVGYRLRTQGPRVHALALLGTGMAVLAAVLASAHFKFHLLPLGPLMVLTLALVCWAGYIAVGLNSPVIAATVMLALFAAPAAVGFSFPTAGVAIAYLLTINLGVTAVAYLKRWDGFLIASLVGSYGLYLQAFGLRDPRTTLLFLVLNYALFLVSGNLFHFWKKSASDFHLGLSMVNPILFACLSYLALLKLPNSVALALYTVIALLHLALTRWATNISGQGPAYNEIARGNWGLSLLFATAAISFVAHIDNSADNFGYVALLLLIQVFGLTYLSKLLPPHLSDLARGGSYWALVLASFQLVALVPFMEHPAAWRLLGALAMLAYFVWQEDPEAGLERRLACNLALACTLGLAYQAAPMVAHTAEILVVLACLAPGSVMLYLRYPRTLAEYRHLPALLTIAVVLGCLGKTWVAGWGSLPLYLVTALLAMQMPLCGEREELKSQRELSLLTTFALILRAIFLLTPPSLLALTASLLFALFSRVYRGSEGRDAAVLVVGSIVGGAPLLLSYPSLVELTPLLLTAGVFAGLGAKALSEDRFSLAVLGLGLALLHILRASLSLSSGNLSTLIWALLGLAFLRLIPTSPRAGLPLLFAAFLKSILWDANFVSGESGWNLTNQLDVASVLCGNLVVGCFALAAHWSGEDTELKTYNTLFGLLVLTFGVTQVLVHLYGTLDDFQILLSGFWACASALFVAFGINRGDKLFRLFGLALLVSSIGKILAIDLWMMEAYDRTAPTFLLGALMMAVSYLYQSNRSKLVVVCPS